MMKKVLLYLWNLLYDIKQKTDLRLHLISDYFYTKKHKPPYVMKCTETVEYILKNKCCVARYGDGEIRLAYGISIQFQESTEKIQKELRKVLGSDEKNLLVCLPSVFDEEGLSVMTDKRKEFWKKHLAFYRKYWYRELVSGKKYGNAFISRNYMNLRDKSTGIKEYFELVKKLWENRDVIIVEGEKSRIGMGNDLFDGAGSVRRILCPSTQCYEKYDEILEKTVPFGKDYLYILALGPTATIMAYDLAKLGYQAIDMGNIDTEYEWFLSGATEKEPVKNKLVYEAGSRDIPEAKDEKYLNEIAVRIN